MFPVNSLVDATELGSLVEISDQYEVLHFYDGPILFTGRNRFGSRILGSLVERDRTARRQRVVHVLVEPSTYGDFLRGQVAYLDILKNAPALFLIDREHGGATSIRRGLLNDIPVPLRPTAESLCPPREVEPSLNFISVIDGRNSEAPRHRADSGALVAWTTGFARLLKEAVQTALPKQMTSVDVAPAAGSLELRFSIDLGDTFPFESYLQYIGRYVDFCINKFPSEFAPVAKLQLEEAPHFAALVSMRSGVFMQDDDGGTVLRASIERSVRGLGEISTFLNSDLTSISVLSSERTLVGTIDKHLTELQESALGEFDAIAHSVTEDTSPKIYPIQIYSLNKESRKGSAYVLGKKDEMPPRARIEIAGSESLDDTAYTHSLDKSIKIRVRAVATKRDKIVTKLRIIEPID